MAKLADHNENSTVPKMNLLESYTKKPQLEAGPARCEPSQECTAAELLVVSHKISSELLNIVACSASMTQNGLPRADEQVGFKSGQN